MKQPYDEVTEAGIISDPPELKHNHDAHGEFVRSKCGACGAPVQAGVFHKCHGNAKFHTPKSQGGYLEDEVQS